MQTIKLYHFFLLLWHGSRPTKPSPIVEGSRRTHPSRRVQGHDYPTTALEELHQREKIKNTSNEYSDTSSSSNQKGKIYLKDQTKPDGEACNEDGTLKDATELEWPDSPTQPGQPNILDNNSVWDYWNLDKNNARKTSIVSNSLSALSSATHLHHERTILVRFLIPTMRR